MTNQQELTPWNFCDYRCEVCRYQESCHVFHAMETERRIMIAEGKDPDDMENVLESVGTDLADALEQVKEAARKFGIDPEAAAREAPPENPLTDDPLFRKAMDLTVEIFRFLEARRPEDPPSEASEQAWDDLAWYHTLFPAKIARALSGLDHAADWNPEWGVPDYRVSAGIALKAIQECQLAFEAVRGELPFSGPEISGFLTKLDEVRVLVRQRFDQAM